MIRTLLYINWVNLKRDRVAMAVTFLLPIIFFSIFAMIFGGMNSSGSGGGSPSIKVIVVDLDQTDISRRFVEAIDDQDALQVFTSPSPTDDEPEPEPYDRDTAHQRVRTGAFPIAIVIPQGFGAEFASFEPESQKIELIYDAANPIALNTTAGLLQAAAMMAAPDILMDKGFEQLENAGGFLTDRQKVIIEDFRAELRGDDDNNADGTEEDPDSATSSFGGLVSIDATDVREGEAGEEEKQPSIVSYYAAAIGVMFLLFSMVGAGGSILEDEERGTLERLLTSRLNMNTLLLGHWLFYMLLGIAQLFLMFLWGEFVFGIDLFTLNHMVGFLIMALFTGAAAAAFGIIFATLCRSRTQLSGISTMVILIMSALGGSMVPRFVMPDFMNSLALFTFNGWALDGFLKVFWYDDPSHTLLQSILNLLPQLSVLLGMAIVFLTASRLLARRWETS